MTEGEMTGRTVLVTGAASGIGAAVSLAFAERGATVVVTDINEAGLEPVVDEITQVGGNGFAARVDLADPASIAVLRDNVLARTGTLNVLVNCAGWNEGRPFLESEPTFMDRVIAINLMGPILMCKAFLPVMLEAQPRASIVNVASDAGRVGSLGETVYASAKGGTIAFTKSLARETARNNLNVNAVSPGPADTPLFHAQPEKIKAALIRAIPFRRLGDPGEVASAVTYLASDAAAYITGQVISVSGGLTMVD